jgi:hypothetical protein
MLPPGLMTKVKITGISIFLGAIAVFTISCKKQENSTGHTAFTRIDSLTEVYLTLQDSMWSTWNLMMKDESEKLEAVNSLLEDMKEVDGANKVQIESLQQQSEQLDHIRFTQKTMENPHVVEEYDFASNALITDVIQLVESHPDFINSVKWQRLADAIKSADQRISTYREEYDQVASQYNDLLDEIGPSLSEIDEKNDGQKKALFSNEEL